MQLTKYKYIKNKKPRFVNGTDDNESLVYSPGYQNTFNPGLSYQQPSNIINRGVILQKNGKLGFDKPIQQYNNITENTYGASGGNIREKQKANNSFNKNWDPSQAIGQTASFAGNAINAYNQPVYNSSDLLSKAGTSTGNINGMQYERQNNVDGNDAMSDLNAQANQNTAQTALGGLAAGASVGSAFGPIGAAAGAVIGGVGGLLFGSSAKKRAQQKLRRQTEQARIKAANTNIFNRASAQSDWMQQQYLNKYGDSQMGVLYANRGKDIPMYNSGKNAWSVDGYTKGPKNSLVGYGEVIANLREGKAAVVTKGKLGVDNQPSSVKEEDSNVILGNDLDLNTGRTFAEQGRPYAEKLHQINKSEKIVGKYGKHSSLSEATKELYNKQISSTKQQLLNNLNDISERQAKQHDMENRIRQYGHYKFGKEDTEILLPSLIGIGEGISRYNNINGQNLERSNTYYQNPYAQRSLSGLASLRYNMYPELTQYQNTQRYNNYNIDQQGGLTAGQKYIAKNSLYNDYISNIANLYQYANNANNQYKSQYYDALMKSGEADRTALTAARRYDDKIYAKAHAARQTAANQALKDVMENIYRFDKRYVDNKRWRDTLGIYQDDMNIKQKDILSRLPQSNAKQSYMFLPAFSYRYTNAPSMMNYVSNYNPYANKFKFLVR